MFKKFFLLTLFGLTFGYIESAVVTYLRALYYPEGFCFPLKLMPFSILITELLRELATMVVLSTVAIITGVSLLEKFSYFIYSFAIWDISYYIWLKLILNWPSSLFTWDILFLIPVPWTGPILAPIIVSLTFIVIAIGLVNSQNKGYLIRITKSDILLAVFAIFFVFVSFIWNFPMVVKSGNPGDYPWGIFLIGQLFGWITFIRILKKAKKPVFPSPMGT